jgi:hypothetical protein
VATAAEGGLSFQRNPHTSFCGSQLEFAIDRFFGAEVSTPGWRCGFWLCGDIEAAKVCTPMVDSFLPTKCNRLAMALVPCRECGASVSTAADTCPHCGVSKPAGSSKRGGGLIALIALGVLVFVMSKMTTSDHSRAPGPGEESQAVKDPETKPETKYTLYDKTRTYYSKNGVIACKTMDDLSRLAQLADDKMAQIEYALGHCDAIEKKTKVRIERQRLVPPTLCVRPEGKIDCLWTPTDAIDVEDAK